MASIVDFRSRPESARLVSAGILPDDDGDAIPVEPVEISDSGALFRTGVDERCTFPLGATVQVVITVAATGEASICPAAVAGRQEAGAARLYLVRWQAGSGGSLSERLRHVFNARGSFRVRSDPGEPVGVVIRASGVRPVEGRILDISMTGLAVLAGLDAEAELCGVTAARVAIQFPGRPAPVGVDAEILGRKLETSGIRYRLSILSSSEPDSVAEDAILDYVMSRQHDLLQKVR